MPVARVLLLFLGAVAAAQDMLHGEMRSLLYEMRAHAEEHRETRGATPQLTSVKHYLRVWIESRLPDLAPQDDGGLFSHSLNMDLAQAGLNCEFHPVGSESKCPDQNLLGFVGPVKVHRSGEFLLVQTAVGIQCGYDESAYAYEFAGHQWRRFWTSEQNEYEEKKYSPQHLDALLISPTNYRRASDQTEHIVLTVGSYPWCSSNWQTVYYRLWQTKGIDEKPKLILDENETSFVAEPISASVWPDDVLIEYAVASIDTGVHNRRRIRHYAVHQGSLRRIDPFVLGPRDFVDDWITSSRTDAGALSEGAAKSNLEKWHEKLKGPFEFDEPTLHCTQDRDLWMVGLHDPETQKPLSYFLVRWRPPYHFTMVDARERPWPSCTEKDAAADEFRTLFPDRDWH